MRLTSIEVVARREALGLTQTELADLLHWKQSRVSETEKNKRQLPGWAAKTLDDAENLVDRIAETLFKDGLAQIQAGSKTATVSTYRQDARFWLEWPDFLGVPASIHRVASVKACRALRAENHQARIVDACEPLPEEKTPRYNTHEARSDGVHGVLTVRVPNLIGATRYDFTEVGRGRWTSSQSSYVLETQREQGESRDQYVERCAEAIHHALVDGSVDDSSRLV